MLKVYYSLPHSELLLDSLDLNIEEIHISQAFIKEKTLQTFLEERTSYFTLQDIKKATDDHPCLLQFRLSTDEGEKIIEHPIKLEPNKPFSEMEIQIGEIWTSIKQATWGGVLSKEFVKEAKEGHQIPRRKERDKEKPEPQKSVTQDKKGIKRRETYTIPWGFRSPYVPMGRALYYTITSILSAVLILASIFILLIVLHLSSESVMVEGIVIFWFSGIIASIIGLLYLPFVWILTTLRIGGLSSISLLSFFLNIPVYNFLNALNKMTQTGKDISYGFLLFSFLLLYGWLTWAIFWRKIISHNKNHDRDN